jgi:hypothetical protein
LQLLAPIFAVLAVIAIGGFSWPTALIVAALAPATALVWGPHATPAGGQRIPAD